MEPSTALKNADIPVYGKVQNSATIEIDRALAVLSAHKDAWARMDIPGRVALLNQTKGLGLF